MAPTGLLWTNTALPPASHPGWGPFPGWGGGPGIAQDGRMWSLCSGDLSPGRGGEGHSRGVSPDGRDSLPCWGHPWAGGGHHPPCPLPLIHVIALMEGQVGRHKVASEWGDSGGGEKEMEEDAEQGTKPVSGKSTGVK